MFHQQISRVNAALLNAWDEANPEKLKLANSKSVNVELLMKSRTVALGLWENSCYTAGSPALTCQEEACVISALFTARSGRSFPPW